MAQQERIPGKINTSQWSTLSGNVHPNALSTYDQGRVDDALEMTSVMLVAKPSASQQAALDQLLADLQNPASAVYRHWLTPEEYADRFGLSAGDISKIEEWAHGQQLTVTGVARGGTR
jgi:subtilase family serine protease